MTLHTFYIHSAIFPILVATMTFFLALIKITGETSVVGAKLEVE